MLADASAKSNFGHYRPPDTVRVAEEEEEEAHGLEAVDKALRSFGSQTSQVIKHGQRRCPGSIELASFGLRSPGS